MNKAHVNNPSWNNTTFAFPLLIIAHCVVDYLLTLLTVLLIQQHDFLTFVTIRYSSVPYTVKNPVKNGEKRRKKTFKNGRIVEYCYMQKI